MENPYEIETAQCNKEKCRICPHCANCDVDDNGLLKEQEAVELQLSESGVWYECPISNRMNNGQWNSLEGQVKEAVERCKARKCEGCPFNGVSACCVTVLLHIQHATATFEKDGHHLRCSNCGECFCSKDCEGNVFPQKYCPNCGAKMEMLKDLEQKQEGQ